MTDIAIRVENLGRRYRIGGKQERYKTLRDSSADVGSRIANFKSDIANPQCPSSSEISAVFDCKGIRVYTGNALGDHSGVLKICLGRLCLK